MAGSRGGGFFYHGYHGYHGWGTNGETEKTFLFLFFYPWLNLWVFFSGLSKREGVPPMAGLRGGGFFYHGYHGSARPATAGRDITDGGQMEKRRKHFYFFSSIRVIRG